MPVHVMACTLFHATERKLTTLFYSDSKEQTGENEYRRSYRNDQPQESAKSSPAQEAEPTGEEVVDVSDTETMQDAQRQDTTAAAFAQQEQGEAGQTDNAPLPLQTDDAPPSFSLEQLLQEEPEPPAPTLKERAISLAGRLRERLTALRSEQNRTTGGIVGDADEQPSSEELEAPKEELEVPKQGAQDGPPDAAPAHEGMAASVMAGPLERAQAAFERVAMAVLVKVFWTGVGTRRCLRRVQEKFHTGLEHCKNFVHYRKWRKAGGRAQEVEGTALVPSPAHEVVERFEQLERTAMIGALAFLTGLPKEEIRLGATRGAKNRYRRAFARRCTTVFIPVASVFLLCAVLYSVKDYTLGVKVYIEGQEVATLQDEEDYEAVATRVERYVSGITGGNYELGVQPTYQMALVNKKDFGATVELEEALLASADDVIYESYGLYVDGELVAVHANEQELEELLTAMLGSYRRDDDDDCAVEFVQDVRIEPGMYARKFESSISDIQLLLTSTVQEEVIYNVRSGDLLGTIAPKFDMTVTQLKALNPSVDERRLQIGTPLTVSKATPFLTVKAVRTVTYDESIPYETEIVKDSSKYTYETSVRTKGVAGVAAVTAQICEIDGMEISRLEVNRQVVSEPTVQVEVRGTKTPPATAPSGTFRAPVTGGTVTSRFGRRSGGTHTGIDIALPTGTSIVAADGGTVTFAGWSGGYGYVVKISHGSSTQTWYAHCSALLVSAGQQVAKGQPIARVGSTGNSTGPHLHFEVRINGSAVNPAPYIGR